MKPVLCWDSQCYSGGVEKLTGIKKRPALLRQNLVGSVSSESAHGSCIPEVASSSTSFWEPNVVMCKSLPRWYWRHGGVRKSSWGSHCVAELEFPESPGEPAGDVQPSSSRDPSTLRRHRGQQRLLSGASPGAGDICVCCRRCQRAAQVWGSHAGHCVSYLHRWSLLCFASVVTVPWFFPLEIRKYLTYFLFYRSPQLRDYNF